MSPARFNQEPKMINGPRPTPLKINKESHVINKPTTTMSSFVAPHYVSKPPPQQQRTQPLIIYTHSPKVIHTQARDFMALVQKLTGLSQSNKYTNNEETKEPTKSKAISTVYNDGNKSSSVVTEDKSRGCGGEDERNGSALVDHHMKEFLNPPHNNNNNNNNTNSHNNHFLDIPLFTPTATDFFCSPRPLYRYGDNSSFASPGIGNLTSPSVLEFLKGLSEY